MILIVLFYRVPVKEEEEVRRQMESQTGKRDDGKRNLVLRLPPRLPGLCRNGVSCRQSVLRQPSVW